jgi:dihydroorotate dehydrogenase
LFGVLAQQRVVTWLYRNLARPALFSLDPEEAHQRTLKLLGWAGRHSLFQEILASFFLPAPLPVQVFGLDFPNPVGLAAGMDKYGEAVSIWESLGFGFCELGGVTWEPQSGNPCPRIFRLPEERALINRMGFNNPGAEALAARLGEWKEAGRWPRHPVGINLGKSKNTPITEAAEDYASSFRALWGLADFFVVNVSSPNTPNLRQLQEKEALKEIFQALQEVNRAMMGRQPSAGGEEIFKAGKPRPLLVKVAPDLSFFALDEMLELAGTCGMAGVVATNTTIERPVNPPPELRALYAEAGGLSGAPLSGRSTEIIRHIHGRTEGKLPIIGVGGIFNAADAWEKITAGATLVQVYTGLVYEGPGMVRQLVEGMRERMAEAGFSNLEQVVRSACRSNLQAASKGL